VPLDPTHRGHVRARELRREGRLSDVGPIVGRVAVDDPHVLATVGRAGDECPPSPIRRRRDVQWARVFGSRARDASSTRHVRASASTKTVWRDSGGCQDVTVRCGSRARNRSGRSVGVAMWPRNRSERRSRTAPVGPGPGHGVGWSRRKDSRGAFQRPTSQSRRSRTPARAHHCWRGRRPNSSPLATPSPRPDADSPLPTRLRPPRAPPCAPGPYVHRVRLLAAPRGGWGYDRRHRYRREPCARSPARPSTRPAAGSRRISARANGWAVRWWTVSACRRDWLIEALALDGADIGRPY
jgi:hypothetical protein